MDKKIIKIMEIINKITQNLFIKDDSDVFIFDIVDNENLLESSYIFVGKNCRVNYVYVFNLDSSNDFSQIRNMEIGDNSIVNSFKLIIGVVNSVFDFNSFLSESSILNNSVLIFQNNSQKYDFEDKYVFKSKNSIGKFNINCILDNDSSIKYFGDLVINKDSQNIDSRIDMKSYIFDNKSKASFLPGLKISANNVKAGHSASTFNLSSDDLFYMNSRGLSESDIKLLVIKSLVDRFVNGIGNEEYEELVRKILQDRR